MISIEDFKEKNGEVDWKSYDEAKINAGEKCYKCGCLIFASSKKYRHLCTECEIMEKDDECVNHSDFIRCPKCRKTWNPADVEQYEVFEDGIHEVQCIECNHEFEVTTCISYDFESPAIIKGEENEN